MPRWIRAAFAVPLVLLGMSSPTPAEPVVIDGIMFDSWEDYGRSAYFQNNGRRCATKPEVVAGLRADPSDCAMTSTNPDPEYDPGTVMLFNVVVHVITTTSGTGDISDEMVESQIEIINEDFRALAGSNGENGNDVAFQFQLATVDPNGDPTDGITRSENNTWFNDGGSYWNTLAWDPARYINVYTNSASGALGYVPNLPQSGIVGFNSDRIVILWSTFGRDAPFVPYDQGRTLTHELGHYFGLWHPFDNGCGQVTPGCYQSGDYVCDTNRQSNPTFGCPGSPTSCGGTDANKDNYMDYSDDLCMEQFTVEQLRRMRCTVEFYRPDLLTPSVVGVDDFAAFRSAKVLRQNVPNPFSPRTQIGFDLPAPSSVSLRVLDVTGRTVRTLASGFHATGSHEVTWNGTNDSDQPVAAGVYFYRLQTEAGSETLRMVKMK